MKTIRLLAGLAVFLFAAHTAMAASYYVRSGAAGANNGADWTNAYTSLPGTLARGATYYIGAGSYGGYSFNDAASGTTVTTVKKATAADHGTSTGWQDSYGTGLASFSGQLNFSTPYWVVDGVTGGGPGSWDTGFGFKITETGASTALIYVSASNVTVRHVEMLGMNNSNTAGGSAGNDGVAIYNGATSFTLSHAYMHGIGRCPAFIPGSGSGGNGTLFEYVHSGTFFGNSAAHSEVMSYGQGAKGNVTWRYSLITDSKSTGGLMWNNNSDPNAHLYIYGNVFYQPSGASWAVANGLIGGWTTSTNNQFSNVSVYNNTFIGIQYLPLSNFPTVYGGNSAKNNIFYNCASPDFSRFGTHDYNTFINAGGSHSESNGVSAASGDPFVDYVHLNFMLTAGTAAGTTLASPFNLDPAGDARGTDGTWDRGAFEFGGAGAPVEVHPSAPQNLRWL